MVPGGIIGSSILTARNRLPGSRATIPGLVLFLLGFSVVLRAQGPPLASPPRTGDVPALLRVAKEALDREDFAAAVKALKSVVEIEPERVAAWFNLAYAYSGLHQDEESFRAYHKTLELQPGLFEARLNLGILSMRMNRPEAALEHLEKAVTLNPQHARARLYYGRALMRAGQPEAAEKQFQEATRLDPHTARASYFDLGQLRLAQKRYPDARAAFQKAAELDPDLVQAQLGLALASEGLNDFAEAVPRFEQYLAANRDDLETRFHLARIYLEQGKNEQALQNLQAVHQKKPGLPGLAAALGDVCALLKRFPDAEQFYREAIGASPSEPDLHRALAQTLLNQKKLAEAETEFRATLKLDARNAEAAKGLATSLYMQKRYVEAIPLFEALAQTPEPVASIVFALATCYDHLRDLPKALAAYERFLALSHNQRPDQEWQARQRVKLLRRELRK